MRAAVVGGGIAGLAAAWELTSLRPGASVTVFEPAHVGGKLLTEPFRGRPVDAGPDAFITRTPAAVQLCHELGLERELVAPEAGRALIWTDGRLRPMPDGLLLGLPTRLSSLVLGGMLSPSGVVRAAGDLVLPRTDWPADPTVEELVSARFGRAVAERLVDPLIGGIHAGSTARLSAAATVPQVLEAARRNRSLLLGLRRLPSAAPSGPVFYSLARGIELLARRLEEALAGRGVRFESTEVTEVSAAPGGVEVDGRRFDAAVMAVTASVAARLLRQAAPAAAEDLAGVRGASVAVITLAFPSAALTLPQGTSGFLVPAAPGHLITACSFASVKWPHWSRDGETVLRVSVGRDGDERAMKMEDGCLADHVVEEVSSMIGPSAEPLGWRVNRWPGSFPQYEVGHLDRVDRVEASLARCLPGVFVAGSSYRGSGIPACIASGRDAAVKAVASMSGDGSGRRSQDLHGGDAKREQRPAG